MEKQERNIQVVELVKAQNFELIKDLDFYFLVSLSNALETNAHYNSVEDEIVVEMSVIAKFLSEYISTHDYHSGMYTILRYYAELVLSSYMIEQ